MSFGENQAQQRGDHLEQPDPRTASARQWVRVRNPQGLHMRPAASFAQLARSFEAAVAVHRGDRRVDGKSVFDLLLLAAEPGASLLLEVTGRDAAAALAALAAVIEAEGDAGPPQA